MKTKTVNLVFGGGGFIGIQLCKALVEKGECVISVDKSDQLKRLFPKSDNFNFILFNMLDDSGLLRKIQKFNFKNCIYKAWHLAANSDIAQGIENIGIDLNDTFLSTVSLVKISKKINIESLVFASSSAVYGDWQGKPLAEADGPLRPISNYGAMKAASEMLLSASITSTLKRVFVARFPNVVGYPPTHGVVFDFFKKLSINSKKLDVLGNGRQQKQYMLSEQLVEILIELENVLSKEYTIINIGPEDDGISVEEIANLVISKYYPKAKAQFQESDRGWQGDVPVFRFDTSLLKSLTNIKVYSSRKAMKVAIKQIATFFGKNRYDY